MFRRFTAAAAIACSLALASCAGSAALAAEAVITAPTTAVVVPYGNWIVEVGQTLSSVLIPALVALIMGVVGKLYPFLRLFVSASLVERLVRNVTDYALNAVAGAVKGQTLTAPVGSAVIAKAMQRAVDQAPAWLVQTAGGPAGIAEKVFRLLKLDDSATAANTLAPAIQALPAKA